METTIFYHLNHGTLCADKLTQQKDSDEITAAGTLSDGRRVRWTFALRDVEPVGPVYIIDGRVTVSK